MRMIGHKKVAGLHQPSISNLLAGVRRRVRMRLTQNCQSQSTGDRSGV